MNSNECVCVCLCCVHVYVQVDPTGSGRVAAADAALFLKRSGLGDLVLGKVSEDSGPCTSSTSFFVFPVYVDDGTCSGESVQFPKRKLYMSL